MSEAAGYMHYGVSHISRMFVHAAQLDSQLPLHRQNQLQHKMHVLYVKRSIMYINKEVN